MSTVIEKTKNPQAQTAKHTPGPWKVWHGSRSVFAHNEHIADIYLPEPREGENGIARTPELIANAKLIAAAPELLEALRDTLEVALNYGIQPNTESSALIRAHNLIKRLGE